MSALALSASLEETVVQEGDPALLPDGSTLLRCSHHQVSVGSSSVRHSHRREVKQWLAAWFTCYGSPGHQAAPRVVPQRACGTAGLFPFLLGFHSPARHGRSDHDMVGGGSSGLHDIQRWPVCVCPYGLHDFKCNMCIEVILFSYFIAT